MPEAQARVVASHLTESAQMATKSELDALRLEMKEEMGQLRLEMKEEMAQLKSSVDQKLGAMETRLVRWHFGTTISIIAVLTALRLLGV